MKSPFFLLVTAAALALVLTGATSAARKPPDVSWKQVPYFDANTMPPEAEMTINAYTGEISWTPTQYHLDDNGGFWSFTVRASDNGTTALAMPWPISTRNRRDCGSRSRGPPRRGMIPFREMMPAMRSGNIKPSR